MGNKGDVCERERWILTTKLLRRQWAGKGHYTMQALGFAQHSNSLRTSVETASSSYHINIIFNTELTHNLFTSRSHNNLKYPPSPIPLA